MIALLKLGSIKLDPQHVAGHELLIMAKEFSADIVGMESYDLQLETLSDYTTIYVVNGPVEKNEERKHFLRDKLHSFKGEFYLVATDPALIPTVEELPVPFVCLSQGQNLSAVHNYLRVAGLACDAIEYYPFEKMEIRHQRYSPQEKSIDVFYGGSARVGMRKNRFEEFYGHLPQDISCVMCGSIIENDFNYSSKIEFLGRTGRDKYLELLARSKATVCLFDPLHIQFGMVTQRVYETVLSDTIAFYDDRHTIQIFPQEIDQFLRVKSTDDFLAKCKEILQDENKRQQIVAQQRSILT